ncbi:MAG TPA: DinB family protein [Fimbriimonadaceae bacterium]|nr:DinB family protein [Fimbriimonadaceae bacterium]
MHPYVVVGLGFGPLVIERLIRLVPADRLDAPTGESRFSPREVVAHMADWEPILRQRIVTALDSPGSPVPLFDEEQMAIEHRYGESDLEAQLRRLAAERARTTDLVKGLTAEQRELTVIHPERGEITVEDMLGMLIGHDMYHIEQLSAVMAHPS